MVKNNPFISIVNFSRCQKRLYLTGNRFLASCIAYEANPSPLFLIKHLTFLALFS
ncbi:MAG: hypothetical protein UT36_C0008G0025 [Candidatus Peregrinibacteria bacterium GW2011_GWF2_39_17]|nr:MAG: hypothetical protein UT36_C0008G0025 [Candidatus Peregrinibacteria bacterium GW2011_GWF2_39_17]